MDGPRVSPASPIRPPPAGYCHPLTLAITFGAYAIGAMTGLAVHRGGPRLRHGWPVYLRIQLVATAGLLGLFSAWRLTAPHQIVAPIVMAAVGAVLLLACFLVRGRRSTGLSQLEGWTAFPNSTFWVLPVGGALVGTQASVVAALTNAAYAIPTAVCIHLLRRDAPIPQRHSTSWLDQSMLVAVAVGLLLHLTGPAPAASHWVLVVAGPLLAFVGAALYTGSVLHPHNSSVDRTAGREPTVAAADRHPGDLAGRGRPGHELDGGGGHRVALGARATRLQSPSKPCCTAIGRAWS